MGQSWFFTNGWARFVRDNKLTKFDMLRFCCFSERQFDVKIYGASGCEKSGVGYREFQSKTINRSYIHFHINFEFVTLITS